MIPSIETLNKEVNFYFPTSKEELMKDIVGGIYTQGSSGQYDSDISRFAWDKVMKSNGFHNIENISILLDYYLSEYIQLFIDAGLIGYYIKYKGINTHIHNKCDGRFHSMSPSSPFIQSIIETLESNGIQEYTHKI